MMDLVFKMDRLSIDMNKSKWPSDFSSAAYSLMLTGEETPKFVLPWAFKKGPSLLLK
jgi:hypothetical protein